MSAWAWAIVGRPEGLRVELPDGRAVVLEGPLPAAVAALLAWASGPEGCEVPTVSPSRPGSTSRGVVGSTEKPRRAPPGKGLSSTERSRLRRLELRERNVQGATMQRSGVQRCNAHATLECNDATLPTNVASNVAGSPELARALSDQDLSLLSPSDSPSLSAISSITEEKKEIARTSGDGCNDATDATVPCNAQDATLANVAPTNVASNVAPEGRIPAEFALAAAPTLAAKKGGKRGAKPASPTLAPLSADWAPTEGHLDIADRRNLSLDLQADRFRAHAERTERRFTSRRNEHACFTSWLLSPYAQPEPAPSAGRSWGRQGRPTQQDPPGTVPFKTGVWEPEPQTPEQDAADEEWMKSRKGAAK